MNRLARLSIVSTLTILAAGVASAGDTPGWRGAARDGHVAGFEAPAEWPEELEKGWSIEVGAGHATPALVGDRLYVHARQGEEEVALCLDAASGKELWRDAYEVGYEMDPTATEHGKGPKSSPLVHDGKVLTFGVTSVLTCYQASDGKKLWQQRFDRFDPPQPRYGSALSPIVVGDLCIVHVGDTKAGGIVAVGLADGAPKWSWDEDGPGYASPVATKVGETTQIITQSESHVVALDAKDGKLLWKMEFKTNYEQNSVTPVIVGDVLIISGYKNGTIAYRLGAGDPEELWRTTKVSMYMSTGVAHEGRLYGFSEKRRGQFFCLDLETGDALWTSDGREGDNAAVWIAGETVIALTTNSELVFFAAKDDDIHEHARYEVADTPTWAHPVIAGKAIYVKDEGSLTRWTLP